MANTTSLVPDDTDPDGDGMVLTRLANALMSRIPVLCTLKTFYDGRERIPSKSIPQSTNQSGYSVYQRFIDICQLDLAKAIADAVIYRQRPTGFRLISDKTLRSTEADSLWRDSRMELKSRQMFRDLSLYGNAYAMVCSPDAPSLIEVLSPWDTFVAKDEDSAVHYSYSAADGKEYLTLYRLVRGDDGEVTDITVRVASNTVDARTLLSESDEQDIYDIANSDTKTPPELSPSFVWDDSAAGGDKDFDYAKACGCLPVVRMHAPNGKGQFEAHIPTLSAIDQQRFQRFCIQELQAFKQRAVSMGSTPEYYKESDPQVRNGQKQAGDKIDYQDMFRTGPDSLWLVPADAKFWESSTTDINPLITAVASDIKHLAAASGTPLDILSPDVAGSAEGAQLKREGLVFKVEDMNARANDGFTRIMRMALYSSKQDMNAAVEHFETVWKPINPPSPLEQAQAAKYAQTNLPFKTNLRRNYGMTEIEISETMQDLMDVQFIEAMGRENRMLEDGASGQYPDAVGGADGFQSPDAGGFDEAADAADSATVDATDGASTIGGADGID